MMIDGTLWLRKVNSMVNSVLKKSDETAQIASNHKRIMKYIKNEVTKKRLELFAQKEAEKGDDRKIKYELEAKRALALEKLFLSLSLIMCIPNDLEQISEQLEEIVELKTCFKNLHLELSRSPSKTPKYHGPSPPCICCTGQ